MKLFLRFLLCCTTLACLCHTEAYGGKKKMPMPDTWLGTVAYKCEASQMTNVANGETRVYDDAIVTYAGGTIWTKSVAVFTTDEYDIAVKTCATWVVNAEVKLKKAHLPSPASDRLVDDLMNVPDIGMPLDDALLALGKPECRALPPMADKNGAVWRNVYAVWGNQWKKRVASFTADDIMGSSRQCVWLNRHANDQLAGHAQNATPDAPPDQH